MKLKEMRKARVKRRRETRLRRQIGRIDMRDQRRRARMTKRQAKRLGRIYKDLTPEEIEATNSIQPYLPQMANELQNSGIELQDPTDPIEVATRYANATPQIQAEVPQEIIDSAYSDENDDNFDDFDRQKAKGILGSAIVGISAGIGNYIQGVKRKPLDQRTPQEQRLLSGAQQVQQAGVTAVSQNLFQQYGIFVIIVLIAWIIFKK